MTVYVLDDPTQANGNFKAGRDEVIPIGTGANTAGRPIMVGHGALVIPTAR